MLIYLAWLNLWVGIYPIFLIRLVYPYVGCYFSEYGAFNIYISEDNYYDYDFIDNLYSGYPADSVDLPLIKEPVSDPIDMITDAEIREALDKEYEEEKDKKTPLEEFGQKEQQLIAAYVKKMSS